MTDENHEVQYLVLPDATNPYFLARVRWPDICQAVSPVRPYWQDDPGLFDLPYDPNSTPVTFDQAEAIAAGWDVRLPADGIASPSGPSIMRRMPADWSNLSRAEKRAWSIEFMTRRQDIAAGDASPASEVATSRTRFGRLRLRRRSVRPALERGELAPEELIVDLTEASTDPVETGAVFLLGGEPASHARDDARVQDVVIDLTDTAEDAPAAVDGA
ncbi:MAG TPA: hypothetical protein VIB48_23850 [Acidimicrobiia bacterium]